MNRAGSRFAAVLALSTGLAMAEPPAAPAPFLFEVEGPAARHYLLGSVHLLPASTQPLPPALDAAYAATHTLVIETDLDAVAAPELQQRMLAAARDDRAGGLEARVGKKLYRRLQVRARQLGMPTPVCAALRAWFCALAIDLHRLQQAGFSPTYGIDRRYFALAQEDGRPVVGLESPEFQIGLFTDMPEALSRQMLAATLDEDTYESQTPEDLLRVWRAGDLDEVERMARELRKHYPDLYARILADRNRAWVSPLVERFKQATPALVVVGAAHLPGPDGLLALLKERGFEARPVAEVQPGPADPR